MATLVARTVLNRIATRKAGDEHGGDGVQHDSEEGHECSTRVGEITEELIGTGRRPEDEAAGIYYDFLRGHPAHEKEQVTEVVRRGTQSSTRPGRSKRRLWRSEASGGKGTAIT